MVRFLSGRTGESERSTMRRCLWVWGCLCLGGPAAAAPESPHPLALSCEDAVAIALGDSYTVRYYREDIHATRASYLYTRAQFKPFLNFYLFAPAWNENLKEISLANGLPVYNSTGSLRAGGNLDFTYVLPTGGNFALTTTMYYQNYRTNLSEEDNRRLERNQFYSRFALTFTQPVFSGNKLREDMREAEMNYKKSASYFTRMQMDIVYNVTESFYEVYKRAYEVHIDEERLKNSREALRITRLKLETGNLPEGEMLIAEIAVAQDEARLMESRGKLETARDEFKLLIGLDMDEAVELKAEMEFEAFPIDARLAVEEALRNRPEVREDSLDIELQALELRRAKRERKIKGDISAYYDFTGLSTRRNGSLGRLIGSSFSDMRERPSNRGVTFTLSYPIADWGRGKYLVRREEYKMKKRELDLENTLRTIEQEVRAVVRSVREAEQRYAINRRNQEVALKSYRISRMRFENGDMTSQELSIEQDRLSQVQLAYIDSYIAYRLSVAELVRKTMYDFKENRSYVRPQAWEGLSGRSGLAGE